MAQSDGRQANGAHHFGGQFPAAASLQVSFLVGWDVRCNEIDTLSNPAPSQLFRKLLPFLSVSTFHHQERYQLTEEVNCLETAQLADEDLVCLQETHVSRFL